MTNEPTLFLDSDYQNFDLEIAAQPDQSYRARVLNSPSGQMQDWITVSLPFSPEELQQSRRLFGGVRKINVVPEEEEEDAKPPLDPQRFGTQLYGAIFVGQIGDLLQRSLALVGERGGLRIRLRLNQAPALADLPWEMLYGPAPFHSFARSPRTPIVRFLATDWPEEALTVALPLRILVVIANPSTPSAPPLNVEAEWTKLNQALAPLQQQKKVVVERLESPTLLALQARLRRTLDKPDIHLLHFIGHGQMGSLIFESEEGKAVSVAAADLGETLREHPMLKVAFLNACEGGRSEESDIFGGVASQLVQQGIPAVIAMKYSISDRAAIDLAAEFYRALADGYTIDAALAEARRAIYLAANQVEWGTPILFMRTTQSTLIDPLDIATIPPCPYPGMVPFRAKDARFFFGREEEIAAMRRHLRNQKQLFVIGPSGSGKSSLIFAGLLPELEEKESGKWQVRMLRPGAAPQIALQEAVGTLIDLSPKPTRKPEAGETKQLLLVVDQFEELFVQNSKTDQNAFIAQLKAIRQLDGVVLIVTMRADFYSDLMHSDLWPIDASQRKEVAPLRGDALRDAIEKPAKKVNVTLGDGLIELLLADAADEPGVLPMLQETMILLWGEQKRRELPLDAYKKLRIQGRNGLTVAMATKADATLANLSSEQQKIACRIFLRLVQFGEGRSDTRRQQSVRDLYQAADDAGLVDKTINALVENRLLTLGGESSDSDRKVDIAHEMLIVGWPTSRSWVQSRREAELTRRRLEEKAKEWGRLGKSGGGLLDEVELAEAERWMASADASDLGYSADLRTLTERSRQVIRAVAAEKEAARQREEDGKRKSAIQTVRATWMRLAIGGLVVLLLVAIAVTIYLFFLRHQVAKQSEISNALFIATNSQLKTDSSNDLALLLAAEAFKPATDLFQSTGLPLIRNQLLYANQRIYEPEIAVLGLHSDQVWGAAYSPDGKTIATSSVDSTIQLWDAATHQPLRRLEAPRIGLSLFRVAISPQYVLAGARGGYLLVWDLATGKLLKNLPVHENDIFALALSPNKKSVATSGSDNSVRITDLATWQSRKIGVHTDWVWDLAFSPDGQLLASASKDKNIGLWDLAAPTGVTATVSLTNHETIVTSLAFYPSITSTILASGDTQGRMIFWDVGQWHKTRRYPSHTPPLTKQRATIWGMDFSPDGQLLASASGRSTFKFWSINLANGVTAIDPQTYSLFLDGHTDQLADIDFSPDGKNVVVASWDGTASLWAVGSGNLLTSHAKSIQSLALAADGKTLWTAATNGTVSSWDSEQHQLKWQTTITPSQSFLLTKLAPDGSLLATTDFSGTLQLYAVVSNALRPITLTSRLTDVAALAFNPAVHQLAAGNSLGAIFLLDLATGQQTRKLEGHNAKIHTLSFSADGKLLASSACDRDDKFPSCAADTVRTWELATGKESGAPLFARSGYVMALAFDHAAKTLASGSADKRVLVWDLASRKELYTHRLHTQRIKALSFNPDDTLLASAGTLGTTDDSSGSIILWDVENGVRFGRSFNEHDDTVNDLIFSIDGNLLYSAAANGFVVVNNLNVEDLFDRACQLANRNLSLREWQQFVKNRPYRKTCEQWPDGEGVINAALPS